MNRLIGGLDYNQGFICNKRKSVKLEAGLDQETRKKQAINVRNKYVIGRKIVPSEQIEKIKDQTFTSF